jgi:putative two-component system hydrogenase maturation factor HypX/HoxX
VVHPGPPGDRGPSSLDWAILEGKTEWGVTVLQANAEMDGGPVWEHRRFPLRAAPKSSLYRNEVTEAAVDAVLACVARFPEARAELVPGLFRPAIRHADRAIDWAADVSETVLRKIRSADGNPGLAAEIEGVTVRLFDAHPAVGLSGEPGRVVARGNGAVAVATRDGAVWVGQMRRDGGIKRAAAFVLTPTPNPSPQGGGERDRAPPPCGEGLGWGAPPDIAYERHGAVGILHFPFHNGAMSTDQCRRLLAAYEDAKAQPTKVIVLAGGPDFWSNGIHLNEIEAAASPADESWANINAMNDLARAIITTTDQVTVSALQGNAGAGGVFLALAADEVWARRGVVLNPHYKGMGNLYGSEYWTYLLPRRAGAEAARRVTDARLPMGVDEARELGLVDKVIEASRESLLAKIKDLAEQIAHESGFPERLIGKKTRLEQDENIKPLAAYRAEELERMTLNFYGFDSSYHVARYNFVRKVAKARTPLFLATHRRKPQVE